MHHLILHITAFLVVGFLSARAELPPLEEIHDTRPNVAVEEAAREYWKARDTKGITELAAKCRASKAHLVNSTWYLALVYYNVTNISEKEDVAAEEMEFFQNWAAEEPDNITAQVCYADALTSYAWKARGNGWAEEVTEEGWRLFYERLHQAQKVIDRAKTLEYCPHLFAVEQRVAVGFGTEREVYMPALDKALKREPSYGSYYTQAYRWMLPRWYGEEGEIERFITQRADAAPDADRDLEYARLVWLLKNFEYRDEIVFAPGHFDWERAKRGFRALIAKNPGDLLPVVACLQLAMMADDRKAAREMCDILGGRYDPKWWSGRNPAKKYEAVRAYAYSAGENPG